MERTGYEVESEHAESLWEVTCAAHKPLPRLEDSTQADLCIVGGGFSGLSAALHAAEQGLSVALLEARTIGWGASGRNGGQVNSLLKVAPQALERRFGHSSAGALRNFASDAADLVFSMIDRHRIACEAVRCGWIRAAHSPRAQRELQSIAADYQRLGAPITWLTAPEMAERSGSNAYLGGMFDPRGGGVHPLAYARGLATAAEQYGVRLFTHSPARSMIFAGDLWRVITAKGEVRSPKVIIATNAYTDGLWPGLAKTVMPTVSHIVATRPLNPTMRIKILPRGVVLSDIRPLVGYYRVDARNRLIAGYTGLPGDIAPCRSVRRIVLATAQIYPHIRLSDIQYCWSGFTALTPDHLPHIEEIAPGVTAILGYNGRGVALSTALGKLAALHVKDQRQAETLYPCAAFQRFVAHGLRRRVLNLGILSYGTIDYVRNALVSRSRN